MQRPRTQYANVGIPVEYRTKLQEIARIMGRFQSEILKELIDKKLESAKKFSSRNQSI